MLNATGSFGERREETLIVHFAVQHFVGTTHNSTMQSAFASQPGYGIGQGESSSSSSPLSKLMRTVDERARSQPFVQQPSILQQAEVIHGQRARVSSNSFASSANQNSGNVLTDRATTRVAAPPGNALS